MTILVTGSAGFIGSNFVNNWFLSNEEEVLSVDALTYAGNLANLKSQENNANHHFVNADISNKSIAYIYIHHPTIPWYVCSINKYNICNTFITPN